MTAKVEIYTTKTCSYCRQAKALLKEKGIEFIEYSIDGDKIARAAMAERANGRYSVPQIFINDRPIGGCDDLYELDDLGKLEQFLQVEP
ncbi:glutaredoxin 3 [Calothrix sp. NIES-4071]|nr:glutaredoxin 3 [Calothrix sp. NIES-4071]BAZ59284.1 glutaredoxin 3 [Calothrix sp. NIES-4105]